MSRSVTSNQRKSICILLQNYYEIDIRVRRKAEALVAAGYEVDVLALQSSHTKERVYSLQGVTVYTVGLGKKRASLARYAFEYIAFFCWAFFKLAALIRRKVYAMIDVNNLPDFLVFAALPGRWKGGKVVFDMHEITPEFYMSKYLMKESSWLVRVLKRIEKASFSFADHVITINHAIQELLESRGLAPGKSTIIMNSVDEEIFASALESGEAGTGDKSRPKFVMMYHGTLTPIYGLDIAIEAFGKAHQQMEGAELWILGNGPEKQSLQALTERLGIKDKVKFVGSVLPEEVPHWLKRCDLGVLATRRDIFLDYSFSNKLSEYIIMGKPVISSRLRAIRSYFSEQALLFFEPHNVEELARQMVRACSDPVIRTSFAARAREEYMPLRWELMKQRYLDMVGTLTGAPGEPRKMTETPILAGTS